MALGTKLLEKIQDVSEDRREYFLELFHNISNETLEQIVHIEVKKGQYILKAGAPADTVYFLLKGKVTGEAYTNRGRTYSFMDFSQMWVLGDYELFYNCEEYVISIRAEEDCSLMILSKQHYHNWVRTDANALYIRMQNILSVLTFERRIDRESLQKSSKERLAMILVRFYETGTKDRTGTYICQFTQSELADKTGVNLRSVQRSIASLRDDGLVSLKSGKMIINSEQYIKMKQYTEE